MTRSHLQHATTALNIIRQVMREAETAGIRMTDDDVIEAATAMMGKEHAPLIGRVWAREFVTYRP